MDEKTKNRLALLWTLLNTSTEIDSSRADVVKIMESIERKIGKKIYLESWKKDISMIELEI